VTSATHKINYELYQCSIYIIYFLVMLVAFSLLLAWWFLVLPILALKEFVLVRDSDYYVLLLCRQEGALLLLLIMRA
jgi:hypothetical protein